MESLFSMAGMVIRGVFGLWLFVFAFLTVVAYRKGAIEQSALTAATTAAFVAGCVMGALALFGTF